MVCLFVCFSGEMAKLHGIFVAQKPCEAIGGYSEKASVSSMLLGRPRV
jgi:hypothetical protein